MDWEKMKVEYVTNPKESYRSLAAKFGISYSQVSSAARKEGWWAQRRAYQDGLREKMERIGDKRVERMARLQGAADKLLGKMEEAIDGLDSKALTGDARLPRGLTGAMKDIQQILDLKAEGDVREQEARIEKLRAGVEKGAGTGVRIVIDGGEESWGQ